MDAKKAAITVGAVFASLIAIQVVKYAAAKFGGVPGAKVAQQIDRVA